jgi:hypothetical protein
MAPELFAPSPDVHYELLEGEAVLLDMRSGRYFGLDVVGTRIWQLVHEGSDFPAVVAALEADFDAPYDVLERDTATFLRQLQERGLVLGQGA